MPLASLLPLAIISGALGVAGTLLHIIPYATRGERKRVIFERWVEALYDRDADERGRHARSAIGTNTLPLGVAVEVEAIVKVKA